MATNVTADPDTRVITVTKVPVGGIVELDVVDDIYEGLKEDWQATATLQRLRFPFTSFGDPKTPTQQIGPYVFFDNASGLRMEPYDASHQLVLNGNLVPTDVTLPIWLDRTGRTIQILSNESAQALTVNADAAAFWDAPRADHVAAGSFGEGVRVAQLNTDVLDAAAISLDGAQYLADRFLLRNIGTGSDGGRDVRSAFRFIRNRQRIVGSTITFYEEDDATVLTTGTVATAAGNPITEIDPA